LKPPEALEPRTQRAFRADVDPILRVPQGEKFTLSTVSILTTAESPLPTTYEDLVIPVTGPVFIDGVSPGDTLEIEICDLNIATIGAMVTLPDYGLFGSRIQASGRVFHLSEDCVELAPNLTVPIVPMVGKLGVGVPVDPPPSSTVGHFGGNMDNKHLGAGSRLYLRAIVSGGMLYVGDLHACQADGESSLTALEVAGEVTLRVAVVPEVPVDIPVVTTPDLVMTIGDGAELDTAVREAATAMAYLLQESNDWSLEEAAMAMSLVGDVGICQLVNPRVSGKVSVPRRFVQDLSDWKTP
jgi:amidase